ncbi:MAG: hypothetical protein ACKOCB_04560 [Planctomycetia bacterium]
MRLPLLSVRLVAVLMLLAGLSLGVFAARALHAGLAEPAAPSGLDATIEAKVALYRQYYALDAVQGDQLRQALQEFDRETVALYRRLREQQPAAFEVLRERVQARIDAIVGPAAAREGR